MFSEAALLYIALGYFSVLLLLGFAVEKSWLPEKLLKLPFLFALSLGAYTGTWSITSAFSFAQSQGYSFISFFLGTSLLFIFTPLLVKPLLTLTQTYRLSSIADLFSFRYKSNWAGAVVACFTLICIIPLMAMQFDKIAEIAIYIIHGLDTPYDYTEHRIWSWALFIFTLTFALLFGNFQTQMHQRQKAVVFISAIQSIIKLICFSFIGGYVVFFIFSGPDDIQQWLNQNPSTLEKLNASIIANNAKTLIIIFFAAAIASPHLFHLTFSENVSAKEMDITRWLFPIYLLLIALPILPILWSTKVAGIDVDERLLTIAIGLVKENSLLVLTGFICFIAAASSSLIMIIISVASICTNHLILPNLSHENQLQAFRSLGVTKRLAMIIISFMAMALLEITQNTNGFYAFGFASFSAACQFLPGILAVIYWPKGNRTGLLAGLFAGFFSWFFVILLPILQEDAFGLMPLFISYFSLSTDSYYTVATSACLGFNMLTFGIISILTYTDAEQHYFAQLCSQDSLSLPLRQKLEVKTAGGFIQKLGSAIGFDLATAEVKIASQQLKMKLSEERPFALRLLRRQVESNLSGLFGPTVARQIVSTHLPFIAFSQNKQNKDIHLIEKTIEQNQDNLTGLALQVDKLRRYHKSTIEQLPMGVCLLGDDGEVILWNQSLATMTAIAAKNIIGANINSLKEPWQSVFHHFINESSRVEHKIAVKMSTTTRWFTFYKTALTDKRNTLQSPNQSIVVEEVTETIKLENELMHHARLASIGRLAAGVAHEIGNPVTGIACLAQNLKLDSDQPEIHETALNITEQTQRISKIVESLVNFAHSGQHKDALKLAETNLSDCIRDAIELIALDNRSIKNYISLDLDDSIIVLADNQRLIQVFINLINNAMDASDDHCKIQIRTKPNQSHTLIEFSDNGHGIDQNSLNQIFDPFFTTKEPGKGTGLGLSIVYSIIEDHQGSIQCVSPISADSKKGTLFNIKLKTAKATASITNNNS